VPDDRRREAGRQDRSRLRLRGPYTPDARERRDRRSLGPVFWFSDNDWAGRAILNRYLRGGEDWDINNDAQWSNYMMQNESLRMQLEDRVLRLAQQLIPRGAGRHTFNETFAAEIENGEDINGYQYLHGTNADVGGFQMSGTAFVHLYYQQTGQHLVEMNVTYRWNDLIDPNPQYGTDTVKSMIAETITFGVADAYRLSITWTAACKVSLVLGGRNTIQGYPGRSP
jgi:hypothetical protein